MFSDTLFSIKYLKPCQNDVTDKDRTPFWMWITIFPTEFGKKALPKVLKCRFYSRRDVDEHIVCLVSFKRKKKKKNLVQFYETAYVETAFRPKRCLRRWVYDDTVLCISYTSLTASLESSRLKRQTLKLKWLSNTGMEREHFNTMDMVRQKTKIDFGKIVSLDSRAKSFLLRHWGTELYQHLMWRFEE